jgi:hypothetical protein
MIEHLLAEIANHSENVLAGLLEQNLMMNLGAIIA